MILHKYVLNPLSLIHICFGYDPVFFVPELRKTFAQLTPEEKNAISHRGVALRAFGEKLKEYMENH